MDFVVADAPERARLRRQINHNGQFGCDVCTVGSEQHFWAPRLRNGELRIGTMRTMEQLQDILDNYRELHLVDRYSGTNNNF